jgi:hypothetical protein
MRNGCYVCVSYCIEPVACPPIACGSGSHLETLPGECCATCVKDDCAEQRKAYRELRAQLLEKYGSLGCMTDADCTVYYEKNACEVGCGVVVPGAAIGYLEMNLPSAAAHLCTPDCAPQPLPCEPPAAPLCEKGRCL